MPGRKFELVSQYQPAGDQPTAIEELVASVQDGEQTQVLLGVTGSGKTYTMAQVIERVQRPALILAPNKILAAQLYGEFKSFFPNNAVEYFVSYYDYYQPEAYVPRSDTYIEKESSVNEAIDRMRHSATRALLERDDVIIVASVSCLYGIGSVETYSAMIFDIKVGEVVDQRELIRKLVALQYKRNDAAFTRGCFRVRGDSLEIFPSHYEDMAWRVTFFGDEIEEIAEFDPLTGTKGAKLEKVRVYANSHYVTPGPTMKQAAAAIKFDSPTEGDGGGEAALVDERIAATSRKLELSAQEISGRIGQLQQFSTTVQSAMSTAAARREEAQRTMEKLQQLASRKRSRAPDVGDGDYPFSSPSSPATEGTEGIDFSDELFDALCQDIPNTFS